MEQELLPGPINTRRDKLNEKEIDLLNFACQYEHSQSEFQTRHFVGDAQITPYQKYKQFLLELRSREEVIESMVVQLEKKEAEMAYEGEKAEQSESPAFKRICAAEIKRLDRERVGIRRRLDQAMYERDQYLKLIKEMYDTGEAYLPDGTDLRDAIQDPYLDSVLEKDHWISRLGKQAALDLLSYGYIGSGNMEAITMLEDKDAVETIQTALVFSNKVRTELALTEGNILKEIENNSGLDTFDIHKMRYRAKEIE